MFPSQAFPPQGFPPQAFPRLLVSVVVGGAAMLESGSHALLEDGVSGIQQEAGPSPGLLLESGLDAMLEDGASQVESEGNPPAPALPSARRAGIALRWCPSSRARLRAR